MSIAPNRNFPKALIATGLAAALVGCGGGSSSDTAMEGSPQSPSQEEMDQKRMEAQQRAISTAKAAFAGAQSTLQTALDSATTDQERIAAYEAMKSASDAFRDALYQNDGSAADLLIATNAYDRATSEISELEMMIEMKDQERQQMALDNAKQTYDSEQQKLNLVLNNPFSDNDDIFNARIEFKNAANTYRNLLIDSEGLQDDKVQAEKVLVELDIEDNDGHINNFIVMASNELINASTSLTQKNPTEAQIKAIDDAINKLSGRINAANLTSAARFPYDRIIAGARTRLIDSRSVATRLQGEAKDHYDAIGHSNLRKNYTASYSDSGNLSFPSDSLDLMAPVEKDKQINVTIDDIPTTLTPSDTLSPTQGWNGEKFTGGNIESYVYSNSQPYSSYYETDDFITKIIGTAVPVPSVANQLATHYVESVYNRRFIELTGITFNSNNIAKIQPNKDENNDNLYNHLDTTLVKGYFNGVEGTFTCTANSVTNSDNMCAAQKLPNGEIILGETLRVGDGFVESDKGVNTDSDSDSLKGAWTFKPTDPDDMVASYASFGYWIQKDATGKKPVSIGSFHDFTGEEKDILSTDANLNRITGTATYSGGAVGQYAFYNAGSTDKSYYGGFTADVMLTADFAGGKVADGQIRGVIDSFMAKDSTDIQAKPVSWQVDLEPTDFNTMGQIGSSNTTGDATWTIDGTQHENQGSRWSGRFSHFVDDDGTTDVTNTAAASAAPGTVTGEFSTYASHSSGEDFARLVGAFGADKD